MKKRGRALALLLAAVLTVSSVPGTVMAADGVKPADGITREQPFWSGTGGSSQFRIPCLVSLNDGTLVAGCDARWNTSLDGGGLDTIVSRSKDGGRTWKYTFANYLGDNGNTHHNDSTAFIDPAMATDGEKVYMIADLCPAGYALNGASHSPVAGKSHDANGNILLADAREWTNCWVADRQDATKYTYHLEKNNKKKADSAYVIKNAAGETVEGYIIDSYFNIKGDGVDTNLFEAESPFQVWPTDYLYLTTSEDGGATWSVPSIINMRKDTEQTLLVGPGRGMITSTNRILFTAYEFTGYDRNSVAIYSDDGGKTWERGQSVTSQSSEAVVTEANGKLYMFTRHGGYYTSDDFGETWSQRQEMGINYCQTCQLTAITYPEKIDGKTAILFAAPSGTGRDSGKIFVGLVNDNGTLDWKYNYSINGSAYYAYSCLTVLPDGTIGLLYESDGTVITYKDFDIADVAKGAAIGNIWCTESDKPVAEVTMASDETKELVLNGLKENAKVTVTSDNEGAVTGTYADGKVKLTAKSVTGMDQAVITVESEGASTTIKVNVTDATNYEIVELKPGETKTYTDTTGNYSNDELTGLDTAIADVTMTGEDAQAVEKQVKAQLATEKAKFEGEKRSLDECLFTFQKVADKDNTYKISAKVGENTVYVNHKKAASQCVCTTTETEILLETPAAGTVALKDTTNTGNSNGAYLYFHKGDLTKLHFDRYSTAVEQCQLELWKKADGAKTESGILGYEKVTDLSQVADGQQYLIAAKATDNNYYVVNPSAESQNFKQVAKVVTENVPVEKEAAVAVGSNVQFSDGVKKIGTCLFTFDKQAEEGKYKISATTEDGQKVYLGPKSAAGAQTPLVATEVVITVAKTDNGFTLAQMDGSSNGGYLYFWKDDESKFHFDRNKSVDSNGKCEFELYKKADNAEATEIPGYTKLNDMSEIEANGKYLIAMKAKDNKYYLLNPATGNEKYKYVAKVTGDMYEDEAIGAKTDITITGKAEGKTSVKIGEKTYFIFVKNNVEKVTLQEGETYNIPGEILNKTEVEQRGIVTLEAQTSMPPYRIVSELTDGTYLFGTKSHIMVNTVSTAGATPKGLGMKSVNFNVDETAKDFMWKLTKSDAGYTMQDVATGKYVNISGQNVELKEEAQVLTVGTKENGGFSVSKDNSYLNNWANTNDKVAGYGSDNNTWYFYTPSSGYIATAAKVGQETLLTSEGVTYIITVVEKKPEVKEYTVTATVNDDKMGSVTLSPEGPKYAAGTKVTATAKVSDESKYEFVNWTKGDEVVSTEKTYEFDIDADVNLQANFKAITYNVTAKVNDGAMGTAALSPNGPKYEAGTEVTATATANEGYEFVNWTVGKEVVSDQAEYKFTVNKEMELTANFKAKEDPKPPVTDDEIKLNITVNDDKMGTVKLDPAKESYEAGENVTAIATAKDGYKFVNWTVDDKIVSDKAEFTFKVDRTLTLKANLEKVSEDPKQETPKTETPKTEDKAVQTGDNSASPILPLAGLALAAGAAVVALRKKED